MTQKWIDDLFPFHSLKLPAKFLTFLDPGSHGSQRFCNPGLRFRGLTLFWCNMLWLNIFWHSFSKKNENWGIAPPPKKKLRFFRKIVFLHFKKKSIVARTMTAGLNVALIMLYQYLKRNPSILLCFFSY